MSRFRRRQMMMAAQVSEALPEYLRFTAQADNSSVQLAKAGTPPEVAIEYSLNGGAWQSYTFNTTISLDTDDYVEFRNASNTVATSLFTSAASYYRFIMSGTIAGSGNIMSLLDKACKSTTVGIGCFRLLFYDCGSLVSSPELPATTLAQNCYREMFRNAGLLSSPCLPATVLANYCYYMMFYNCRSLIQSGHVAATTFGAASLDTMFGSCINCLSYDFASLDNSGTVFSGNNSCISFTCRAVTPPTIGSNTITGLPADCIIYVPAESVEAYKAKQYWSDRASYIQAIPT